MKTKPKSCTYRMLMILLGLIGICLLTSLISVISNQTLPDKDTSNILSVQDKARLSEALQLKIELGDQVWQGLNNANTPVILWNESYEFLVNYEDETSSGWVKITDDDLNGQSYFRRIADKPQNFAVRVGDRWAASIGSKQTTDTFLIESFQDVFPSPIKQIFPYRLLLQPSETQIGAVLHEIFHVYQYQIAPKRMEEAEAIHQLEERYEGAAEEFSTEWKNESALLADALKAETQKEKIDLVRQFLSARDARRNEHQMNADLIDYERWLEWEEGTAKYIEMAILKTASESENYQPLPQMKDDPDFKSYQKFDQRWSQELFQLRYQTTSGSSQFYMTGMAQAFLLEDLMPNWQERYWEENIFLEDLLRIAINE